MTLQEEIGKRQPFDSLQQEACLNLVRTCDRVEWIFQRLFRASGITGPQYNILRILRGNGNPGMPSLRIAAQMVTCVPDITRLIDRLELTGLVQRQRCQSDRRVVLVFLTPKGEQLLKELDQPILELHEQVLGHMTAEELNDLNRLLTKARERLHVSSEETTATNAPSSSDPPPTLAASSLRKRRGS